MGLSEDLPAGLAEAVYRQAPGAKEKCIALTRQLAQVYAAERQLNERLSQQGHEDFLRLQDAHSQVLAALFEGKAPPLADPSAFFSEEELQSPEFARAAATPIDRKGWWARTLHALPAVDALIESEDEDALGFLSDVRVSTQPARMDFSVEFAFEPNPFFSNATLRVEALHEGGEEVVELRATPVQWREGRDLTSVTKSAKGKGKGRPKKTVSVRKRSFFLVFANLRQPDDDDEDEEEPDPDAPPTDAQVFYDACDVLATLRHDLIPCLVPTLLGVKVGFLGEDGAPVARGEEWALGELRLVLARLLSRLPRPRCRTGGEAAGRAARGEPRPRARGPRGAADHPSKLPSHSAHHLCGAVPRGHPRPRPRARAPR